MKNDCEVYGKLQYTKQKMTINPRKSINKVYEK